MCGLVLVTKAPWVAAVAMVFSCFFNDQPKCVTVVFNKEVMAELVHVQRDAIGEAKITTALSGSKN